MLRKRNIEPRLTRSPADFETAAADWIRLWGFHAVHLTRQSRDGGIDVESLEAVAQVKSWMAPVGRPEVQQLKGAAYDGRIPIFFSLMTYTADAIEFANTADVSLFRFSGYHGEIEPINRHARALLVDRELSHSDSADSNSIFEGHPVFEAVLTALAQAQSSGNGMGIFESRRLPSRYVQFSLEKHLVVESVGICNLVEKAQLSAIEQERLAAMGWIGAADENFRVVYLFPPFRLTEAASLLARTLIEIHGITKCEDMKVFVE